MHEFGEDYLQSELSRSISDLQQAYAGLSRAQYAATLTDEDARKSWVLALANARSALLLACTISVRETESQLSRSDRMHAGAPPDASTQ